MVCIYVCMYVLNILESNSIDIASDVRGGGGNIRGRKEGRDSMLVNQQRNETQGSKRPGCVDSREGGGRNRICARGDAFVFLSIPTVRDGVFGPRLRHAQTGHAARHGVFIAPPPSES